MFSTVVGILTLSVLGVVSERLFRVDIVIPQKQGRKEIDDINFIDSTLSKLKTSGVKVIFARKEFDNGKVLLVLDVEQTCRWSDLTSAMSEQGYELTVTPLQKCSDYAAELGVNVLYTPIDEINQNDVLQYFRVQFYDEGLSTDQYIDRMKKYFEGDSEVMTGGGKFVCFLNMRELPAKFMYLGTATAVELKKDYKDLRNEAKASIKLDFVQSFSAYTKKC